MICSKCKDMLRSYQTRKQKKTNNEDKTSYLYAVQKEKDDRFFIQNEKILLQVK